jgi:cytochrome P450
MTQDSTLADVRQFSLYESWSQDAFYAALSQIQKECPIGWSEKFGGHWVVTGRDQIAEVMRNPEIYSSEVFAIPAHTDPLGPAIPLQIDPPDHGLYRRDLQRMFSPTVISRTAEGARKRAREYLKRLAERDRVEAVSEFCEPFPGVTMALMLGVPVEALRQLLYWRDVIVREGFSPDPEKRRYAADVIRPTIAAYFGAMVAIRREQGADAPDDLLRALAEARFGDRPWTDNEILRTLHTIMAAGLDTTSAALAMSMQYLATHVDVQRELRSDLSRIPAAVEELLRLFSSVSIGRIITRDTTLSGVSLHKGEQVLLVTPASGRDGTVYDNPAELDLDRGPTQHLAFGMGPHRCLGSHLARMNLTVAFEEMLALLPEFRLTPGREPAFHAGMILGLDELWLDIGAHAEAGA